jgi:hypothetical protein
MSPEEAGWEAGAARVAELLVAARGLELEIDSGESDSPVLAAVGAGEGDDAQGAILARGHGVAVHARMEAPKLERILRQALRAAALTHALVTGESRTGELRVPSFTITPTVVFTASPRPFEAALIEAREHGGLTPSEYARDVELGSRSFADRRGWRTSAWRSEADDQALLLWMLVERILGPEAQPCLVAGHLNWLALEFLGTTLPSVSWKESSQGEWEGVRTSTGERTRFESESLWRSARRGLHGTRSWMVLRAIEGRDPPWSRSMVASIGRVNGEDLLKATLVSAFLHESGSFPEVLAATRGREDRVPAFEAALASTLPNFEQRWRRWLLRVPPVPPGILQLLADPALLAERNEAPPDFLLELNRIRRAAFRAQAIDLGPVVLDEELSRGAEAHAGYLELHEDQQQAWPQAHEEYAHRAGFSPAGVRAGLHGLIAFTEEPVDAVTQWMGTLYHRIPLLDPGLLGVGFGKAGGVCVLDVTSLVLDTGDDRWVRWPHDGMRAVPRASVPDLPNPVPGERQAEWGYPITLQAFLAAQDRELDIRLSLHEWDEKERAVACWFVTPEQPFQPELAPPNTWCLIPRKRLKASTKYGVVVAGRSAPPGLSWTFETE